MAYLRMNACEPQPSTLRSPVPPCADRRTRAVQQPRDAHLATRRSGDRCNSGPLQTPSDGSTFRRLHTVRLRLRIPLEAANDPYTRPKSFEPSASAWGTGGDQAHRTAERRGRSLRCGNAASSCRSHCLSPLFCCRNKVTFLTSSTLYPVFCLPPPIHKKFTP